MDNQVKPTRVGTLESLISNARDAFLVGMAQQIDERKKTNQEEKAKSSLKFQKPMQTLGLDHGEMPTFDTENAKEFG